MGHVVDVPQATPNHDEQHGKADDDSPAGPSSTPAPRRLAMATSFGLLLLEHLLTQCRQTVMVGHWD